MQSLEFTDTALARILARDAAKGTARGLLEIIRELNLADTPENRYRVESALRAARWIVHPSMPLWNAPRADGTAPLTIDTAPYDRNGNSAYAYTAAAANPLWRQYAESHCRVRGLQPHTAQWDEQYRRRAREHLNADAEARVVAYQLLADRWLDRGDGSIRGYWLMRRDMERESLLAIEESAGNGIASGDPVATPYEITPHGHCARCGANAEDCATCNDDDDTPVEESRDAAAIASMRGDLTLRKRLGVVEFRGLYPVAIAKSEADICLAYAAICVEWRRRAQIRLQSATAQRDTHAQIRAENQIGLWDGLRKEYIALAESLASLEN